MNMDNDNSVDELIFKILILGDTSVGKTCLFHRFTDGGFTSQYKTTIGTDFGAKTVQWSDKIRVRLNFWDMAGQEKFYEACKSHFRGVDGVFCVMDLERPLSSVKCHEWRERALKLSTGFINENNNPPIICLANKYDVYNREQFKMEAPSQNREEIDILTNPNNPDNALSVDNAECLLADTDCILQPQTSSAVDEFTLFSKWSKQAGYNDGFMVSAKEMINIDSALKALIQMMVERYIDAKVGGLIHDSEKDGSFQLGSPEEEKARESYYKYYSNSCGKC